VVLPTFPTVLNYDAEFDWGEYDPANEVHAEQSIEVYGPLPVAGTARIVTTAKALYDKGSGALAVFEAIGADAATGRPLFSMGGSLFIIGEGGFGGERGPRSGSDALPERPPDVVIFQETRRDQALLYRLSGDTNPLHTDPDVAARAGFPTPILHGLCTYGFAGRALLRAVCDGDVRRFRSMSGRFTSPVVPGSLLRTDIWRTDTGAAFRVAVGDRTVIDHGVFVLAPDAEPSICPPTPQVA
jgi:acyl dehydratase